MFVLWDVESPKGSVCVAKDKGPETKNDNRCYMNNKYTMSVFIWQKR